MLRIRDLVPFLTPGSGWVKNQDMGSGSGRNIPNHISESIETIFLVKNPGPGIFLTLDPGSGMENIQIWDIPVYPGSASGLSVQG